MSIRSVHPVLRAYDLKRTLRFYVDYLGFRLDWQEGDGSGPTYAQASLGPLQLHLSTHHGDGTPGTVVLLEVEDLEGVLRTLHGKDYPLLNPA